MSVYVSDSLDPVIHSVYVSDSLDAVIHSGWDWVPSSSLLMIKKRKSVWQNQETSWEYSHQFTQTYSMVSTSNRYMVISTKIKKSSRSLISDKLEVFKSWYQSTNNVLHDLRKVRTEK